MSYNPNIHHRKSIRLKGYDYTQAGLYFITICVQNRECLLGTIRRGEPTCSPNTTPQPEMILNDAGKMVQKWYYELENKFADIRCHEMIIMPNHFHCIIENVGHTVGADLRVCPDTNIADTNILGEQETNILGEHGNNILGEHETNILGEHIGSPLHRVVQWFKTMTTNEYIRGVKTLGWKPFDGKLWQRNYWEHIIRNENEYNRIAQYILKNPQNWDNDTLK
ncbi:hypothetical protein PIECOFPK_02248 [Mycovorax composti]|uniref:Transposase IS200-like domain-containing protein n=1 Tax=Mycovorax composti TaxID=2962693 RepID=A0ABZ2ELV0_9BACT